MKMMLRPPSRSFARTPNRRSISGGDKRRGRLVENDDARAGEQDAREFDQLLHADRKIAEPGARVDVEPEVLELLGGGFGHPPPRDDAQPVDRLGAEKDILGDAQFRRDAELLMHHADARRQRVARRAEMHVLPVDAHASRNRRRWTPAMIFIIVLLPAPFSPARPWI